MNKSEAFTKELSEKEIEFLNILRKNKSVESKNYKLARNMEDRGLISLEYVKEPGKMSASVIARLTLIGKISLATQS